MQTSEAVVSGMNRAGLHLSALSISFYGSALLSPRAMKLEPRVKRVSLLAIRI